jgi:hypothetical protein
MRQTYGWLALLALAVMAMVLAQLLFGGGCSLGPRVECPYGTLPVLISVKRVVESGGNATGSLPTESVTAAGTWKGSGETAWQCERICPEGTAILMSETEKGKHVQCRSVVELRRDGGSK